MRAGDSPADMTQQSLPGAILFDLDGTLVDTVPDLAWAMNAMLSEIGRRAITADELRGWLGDGVSALVDRGLAATGGPGELPAATRVERFVALYGSRVAAMSRAYPGVEATLRTLLAAGHSLGVCTNKPTALSVELLSALGLSALFAAIVGGDAIAVRKPHPRHIAATLEAMGATRRRALMVGDSANDVAVARAAGIPVVVVAYGYSPTPHTEMGADAVIADFSELPEVVGRLL
jgi:phosphoglycolate phosphatase